MDDFVCGKLNEWGLGEYIPKFKENKVKKDNFLRLLREEHIRELIPEIGPRATFIDRLENLKEEMGHRKKDSVQPSTSAALLGTMEMGRDKIQEIINRVKDKLPDDKDEIIAFLRNMIVELDTDQKEQVGVFGKTGAGKSSLINAVIGVEDLLPTGVGRACTSVIIKLEANTDTNKQKYVANVEFITEKELGDLAWSTERLFGSRSKKIKVDEEDKESYEKMTALFGNDCYKDPYKKFLKSGKYKDMLNAIKCTKSLDCDSANTLSEELTKYTQNVRDPSGPLFWPVVKCVTIKVPNCDLLRHVTLVDLPGTGDRNKTRNEMWKEMVSSCRTVWIVTEVKRPIDEREPWEILKSACSRLGNGGECRNIHFICTQADVHQGKFSPELVKKDVREEFEKLPEVQNHLAPECFEVFIVSATDKDMQENEISDLKKKLESLNNPRELVLRFESDAFGIVALIQGARSIDINQINALSISLRAKVKEELKKIDIQMRSAYERFEMSLTEGVNTAKRQWESAWDEKIKPIKYQRLKSILRYEGVQKTKTGDHINMNTTLSSFLTNSIDRQFKETFPNAGKDGPFYGAVCAFSLDPESLTKNNKDVELLLKFLESEEEKLKVKFCTVICEKKKQIYNSLTETVTKEMLSAYTEAELKGGRGSEELMKRILKDHIKENDIFKKAKDTMLKELDLLMRDIIKQIEDHLEKAMDMSLRRDITSVPDVTEEFNEMKTLYNETPLNN